MKINGILNVQEGTFSSQSSTNIHRLSDALLGSPEVMSPIVTQAYGKFSDWFPLMLMTEGAGRKKALKKSLDGSYVLPIMGKPKKSDTIVRCDYTSSDVIGRGKNLFKVVFANNIWGRDSDIMNGSRGTGQLLLKIVTKPVRVQDGWEHTLRLEGRNVNATVPLAELKAGKRWALQAASVGIYDSEGNESRNQTPGKFQNQVNFIRRSYKYSGNVQNKTMNITLDTDKGNVTLFTDWEAYEKQIRFREECENILWYSQWNRDENNTIHDYDINGDSTITRGSGVLEQIPNETTYSIMTEKKITEIVQNVLYNSAPGVRKDIVMFSGIGGRRVFQEALMKSAKVLGLQATSDKFIRGNDPMSMQYGAYFGSLLTQDGHTITIKNLPLLDTGSKAAASEKIDGLPETSFDMYFLDMSTVEGEPNIQFVYEEGREYIEKIVPGLTTPKGYPDSQIAASSKDAGSVECARSLGVYIKNPINCMKVTRPLA